MVLLLLLILCFSCYVFLFSPSLNSVTLFSILEFLLMIILFHEQKRLMSVSFLFILFSFLVNCAHPVLILVGYGDKIKNAMMPYFTSMEMYIKAMILVVFVHFFVFIGCFFFNDCSNNGKQSISLFDCSICHSIRQIAIILLLLSLPFRLYNDFSKIIVFLASGYDASLISVSSGLITSISKFFDIGVFALLISFSNEKKKAVITLIVYSFFVLLVMLTGNRGYGMCCLLAVFLLMFKLYRIKLRFKSLIIMLLLGYIMGSLLITISEYRLSGNYSILFQRLFINIFSGRVFSRFLDEFGTTLVTTCHSIESFPNVHQFTYGANYIKSLILVFPNVLGYVDSVAKSETYSAYFILKHEIGGSFIGELYYAFGFISPLFSFFIGKLLGKIDKSIDNSIRQGNALMLLCSFVFVPALFWWVRDYFWGVVRSVSWSLIVIYLLTTITKKRRILSNKYSNRINSLI